jgi:hypothetical protein
MLKFTSLVLGSFVSAISIAANAQATTLRTNLLSIQQPAPNLQSLFFPHGSSSPSPSLPDNSQPVDRQPGFGSFDHHSQPIGNPLGFGSFKDPFPSSHPASTPGTNPNCPDNYYYDPRCNASTTPTEGKSLNPASTNPTKLKDSKPAFKPSSNSTKNLYRVRWGKNSKL